MNNTFYQQQANEYFSKCQVICTEKNQHHPTINYSVVSKKNRKDYYHYTPVHINLNHVSEQPLEKVLDICFEYPALFPDENTYYIGDISEYDETPYNSIMFQLNEPPKISKENTTEIMNRYFKSKRVPYSLMHKIGSPLGYKSALPYVVGEICFLPNRGTSKNTASWYGLHHISDYTYNSKNKELLLFSNHYPLLTIKTEKNSFEKQLNRAAHMYYIQSRIAVNHLSNYSSFKIEPKAQNILDKHVHLNSYHMPNYTMFDIIYYFINYQTHKILGLVLGTDNPYLDEIKKRFKFPKLPS